jgi:hypothetical protein
MRNFLPQAYLYPSKEYFVPGFLTVFVYFSSFQTFGIGVTENAEFVARMHLVHQH